VTGTIISPSRDLNGVPKADKPTLTSTNLVSIGQSAPRLVGPVEDVAPNEEHGRLLVLGREIVIERIVCAVGSIVESVAHRPGFRYVTHVGGYSRDLRGCTMSESEPCWKTQKNGERRFLFAKWGSDSARR
jgi:hypothetical protein